MASVGSVGNVDLEKLLQQYRQPDADKPAVEKQISKLLPRILPEDVSSLGGQDRKTFDQVTSLDSFNKLPQPAGFDRKDFLAQVAALVPEGAERGRVEFETAHIKSRRGASRQVAETPAQATMDRLVGPETSESVSAIAAFIERLAPGPFKRKLVKELDGLKANIMNMQIEAEGFQTPFMKQVLAELQGQKSNLSAPQKEWLKKSFGDPSKQDELFKTVTRCLDVEKLASFRTLSLEQQHMLRTLVAGQKEAIGLIAKLADKDGLTAKEKEFIARTCADFDPDKKDPPLEMPKPAGAEQTAAEKSLAEAVANFNLEREASYRRAESSYNEIMGLLNSGMPIEALLMAVLGRTTERASDKLRLKMREQALAERFEAAQAPMPTYLKSSAALNQDIQVLMQNWSQMTQALSAIMKMVQDMAHTPIQNMRS